MNRAQWMFVCATAALAFMAYVKADSLARSLNAGVYRKPSDWTA